MKPKVSILMAVFNGGEALRESIGSLCQQTLREIEIVCVDDYSTDNSAEIIREMMAEDPRIKLVSSDENMGTVHSRKAGVENADGEYLIFMDQDDRFEPFAAEELYNMAVEKKADIVHFRSRVIAVPPTTEKQRKWQEDFMAPYDGFLYGRDVFDGCFGKNPSEEKTWYKYTWNLWNKIYKTDVCKKAMQDCCDDYIINGDDMYVYMLISYCANSYYGDAHGKFYHIYSLGSGLMGNHKLSLKRFYTLVRRVTGLECEEKFFSGLDDSFRVAYDIDVRRGLQGIVERWYHRLEPQSYGDGYDMMLAYIDPADLTAAFEKHLHVGNVNLFNAVKESVSAQLTHKYTKQIAIYADIKSDKQALAKAVTVWRSKGCKIIYITESGMDAKELPMSDTVPVFALAPVKSEPLFYEYPYRERQRSLKKHLEENHIDCLVYFTNIRHNYVFDLILAKTLGLKFTVYAADFKAFKKERTPQKFGEYINTLECSDGIMLPQGCKNESENTSKYSVTPDHSDIFTLEQPSDSEMSKLESIIEDGEFRKMCEKLAFRRMFRKSGFKTKLKLIVKKILRCFGIHKDYYCSDYDSYYMLKKIAGKN